ncbi:hypothetical protein WDW86_04460 [Bdellovibrionota bacterium FG-2]
MTQISVAGKALFLVGSFFSLAFTPAAYADPATTTQAPDFSKHKQAFIVELDRHLTALQTAKNCTTAAQDHDALKKCRDELHKTRMQMQSEMKDKHKQSLDARIKKLQDEKAKMEQH